MENVPLARVGGISGSLRMSWERQVVVDTFRYTSRRPVRKVVTHVTSRIELNYRLCMARETLMQVANSPGNCHCTQANNVLH